MIHKYIGKVSSEFYEQASDCINNIMDICEDNYMNNNIWLWGNISEHDRSQMLNKLSTLRFFTRIHLIACDIRQNRYLNGNLLGTERLDHI